jgi:predicted transposase YdaD
MSKPFDAATKHLVETMPADWLALAGVTGVTAQTIDADLSTVTAAADKAILVTSPARWLVNLEPQSGPDKWLDKRLCEYGVLLDGKYNLPVQTIVILLRRAADGRHVTGEYRRSLPNGACYQWFKYQVIRLWEQPVEALLQSGLGTLPLTPLADVKRTALPGVIQRMKERIEGEAPPDEQPFLWTATYVLMGLRYPPELTQQLLRGVRDMKESSTYQEIVKEGIAIGEVRGEVRGEARGLVKEAQTIVLRMGAKRFGPPTVRVRKKIESITSVERLELLAERLLDGTSWQELLSKS